MKFTITDPSDSTIIELIARPEDSHGDQGLRIILPQKDSFVMIEKNGEWNVVEKADINPEMLRMTSLRSIFNRLTLKWPICKIMCLVQC